MNNNSSVLWKKEEKLETCFVLMKLLPPLLNERFKTLHPREHEISMAQQRPKFYKWCFQCISSYFDKVADVKYLS
jgi:hypothetical protein